MWRETLEAAERDRLYAEGGTDSVLIKCQSVCETLNAELHDSRFLSPKTFTRSTNAYSLSANVLLSVARFCWLSGQYLHAVCVFLDVVLFFEKKNEKTQDFPDDWLRIYLSLKEDLHNWRFQMLDAYPRQDIQVNLSLCWLLAISWHLIPSSCCQCFLNGSLTHTPFKPPQKALVDVYS